MLFKSDPSRHETGRRLAGASPRHDEGKEVLVGILITLDFTVVIIGKCRTLLVVVQPSLIFFIQNAMLIETWRKSSPF